MNVKLNVLNFLSILIVNKIYKPIAAIIIELIIRSGHVNLIKQSEIYIQNNIE